MASVLNSSDDESNGIITDEEGPILATRQCLMRMDPSTGKYHEVDDEGFINRKPLQEVLRLRRLDLMQRQVAEAVPYTKSKKVHNANMP